MYDSEYLVYLRGVGVNCRLMLSVICDVVDSDVLAVSWTGHPKVNFLFLEPFFANYCEFCLHYQPQNTSKVKVCVLNFQVYLA